MLGTLVRMMKGEEKEDGGSVITNGHANSHKNDNVCYFGQH